MKLLKSALVAAFIVGAMTPSALALSNDTITAIFGSGNPDTGWESETGPDGMKLALRGKSYDTGATPNDNAGTYSFPTGLNTLGNRAFWNYEFSISTGANPLNASGFDFYLSVDMDPSQGIGYQTVNALTFFSDNEYGTATTANGFGDKGTFATYGHNTIAQNSQNIIWLAGLDPFDHATYNFELYAVTAGTGALALPQASVGITVVVGDGGAPVPEGGASIALLGLGALALGGLNMRRKAA